MDAYTVWAVGEGGTIIKTSDGGAHWNIQNSGTGNTLYGVCAVDANTAWAVGFGGTVLKTTDGGSLWAKQDIGAGDILKDICAVDANTAWAVGGYYNVFKTSDGGGSWISQETGFRMDFLGVSAANAGTAWVVGKDEQCMLKTTDGGNTWTPQTPPHTTIIHAVDAVDHNVVWAAGGAVYTTSNGGSSWDWHAEGASYGLEDISAVDANIAWVVTREGTIRKTVDGGDSWVGQDAGTDKDLLGVCAVNGSRAWVVGDDGIILHTTNGGSTWPHQTQGIMSNFYGVSAVDTNTAWAVGIGEPVVKTTDGGNNWVAQETGGDYYLCGVSAVDANTVWAVSIYGSVIKSDNGGKTWKHSTAGTSGYYQGIAAVDAQTAWVVGDDGAILKTSNGGDSWQLQHSDLDTVFYCVAAADAQTAWVGGWAGEILKTTDGGASWIPNETFTDSSIYGICAVDKDNAWAAGSNGVVIRVTDGGTWWNDKTPKAGGGYIVTAVDADTAWIASYSSISKTTDGGDSWVRQFYGLGNDIEGICAVDADTAWAVGGGGMILHTNNGGGLVPVTTWYFAEGYTGTGFQEYICLGNPQDAKAVAIITYMFSDGATQEQKVEIPANSRTTVDVNQAVGEGREVSCLVEASDWIVVERPMYFSYQGVWAGGHDVVGAGCPAHTWCFAEGYTGAGFEEWVCVMNPGDIAAHLTFRFQTQEEGEKVISGFSVQPHSRGSFKVNDLLGGSYQTSLKLESDQVIVAERPMYFQYQGMGAHQWRGGHCVMGATSLSTEYCFSEGTTRYPNFEQWITLQNPNDTPITVAAVYQLGAGQGDPVERTYEVPARSRQTVFVEDEVGRDKDVSVKLSSEEAFLAERPLYFNYEYKGLTTQGGHCVIGADSPEWLWFLAEGYTGDSFNQWLCLQNPYDEEAVVEITYCTQEEGALEKRVINLPATSRETVMVNEDAGWGYQLSCKVEVTSGPDIVVERPMYFNFRGQDGGHDVVGYVP